MSHTEEIRISIFLPTNEKTINEQQQRDAAAGQQQQQSLRLCAGKQLSGPKFVKLKVNCSNRLQFANGTNNNSYYCLQQRHATLNQTREIGAVNICNAESRNKFRGELAGEENKNKKRTLGNTKREYGATCIDLKENNRK